MLGKLVKIIVVLIFLFIFYFLSSFFIGFLKEIVFFKVFGMKSLELESEVHPVLLYNNAQLNTIKQRISLSPYKEWYNKIKKRCDSYNPNEIKDEREKAKASKELAFCYVIEGNSNYATNSEKLLERAGKTKFNNIVSDYNYGLIYYSQAYDMLKGSGWTFKDEEEIRKNIKNLMLKRNDFVKLAIDYPNDIPGMLSLANNHELRKAAALGIASIALADDEESKDVFKSSQLSFAQVIMLQSGGEPVWGEGPNYFAYAMEAGLPYMRAFKNYFGINLMEKLDNLFEWEFNLTMNDGRLPNFDDAEYSHLIWPLVETKNSWKYLYVWEKTPYQGELGVDVVVSYENISREYKFPKLTIMNKTGAVFRGKNLYLLFLAENGIASTPFGHEHPDGLSIILQRGNEVIIPDSGYWAIDKKDNKNIRRPWLVNKAINHNSILVDNVGMPEKYKIHQLEAILNMLTGFDKETDAYIKEFSEQKYGSYATAFSRYNSAYLERSVAFFNKEYFVIFDKAISDHKRDYSLLFHTGEKKIEIRNNSALWKNCRLISTAPIKSFEQYISVDKYAVKQLTLNITKRGEIAYFITIIYPNSESIKNWEVGEDANSVFIILEGKEGVDYIIFNKDDEINKFGIKSDSDWVIVRIKNKKMDKYLKRGGSFISFSG